MSIMQRALLRNLTSQEKFMSKSVYTEMGLYLVIVVVNREKWHMNSPHYNDGLVAIQILSGSISLFGGSLCLPVGSG